MGSSMAANNLEIEHKYDAAPSVRLPDLHDLPGVTTAAQPVEHRLEATYFDTPDLRLANRGITVRRRTGGPDAGWHLKLPTPDGDREELQRPLDDGDAVPASLADLVRVHVRDRELAPVARISTRRVVRRLLDADGDPLAEVSDDEVTAEALGAAATDARVATWREIEVELVDGDRSFLDRVGERLEAAGAAPSRSPAKLVRVLGDRLTPQPPAMEVELSPGAPASAVVHAYLREQVDRLQAWDPKVRRDEPDAVHKMRVASRRLRSALATYRPLLDREATEPVRDELRWLGEVLGAARDAEVMHERLRTTLDQEPAELVLGGVVRRIDGDLKSRYRKAHKELLAAMDSDRYFRLLDSLDELAANPPFTDQGTEPAGEVLPRRVRKAWQRVRRFADGAAAAKSADERIYLLHEVRKAAKRARYAAESVQDVFGRPASRFAKRMEKVQDLLGDHHDSVVVRELVRQMGVQAHLAGENAFTYGRIHALKQVRADQAESDFAKAWAAASRKKLRRWLR
jgi:CHAD domain-containing protein